MRSRIVSGCRKEKNTCSARELFVGIRGMVTASTGKAARVPVPLRERSRAFSPVTALPQAAVAPWASQ
jgi:hypothetical protein